MFKATEMQLCVSRLMTPAVHLPEMPRVLVRFLYKLIIASLRPDVLRPTNHRVIPGSGDFHLFDSALRALRYTLLVLICIFA